MSLTQHSNRVEANKAKRQASVQPLNFDNGEGLIGTSSEPDVSHQPLSQLVWPSTSSFGCADCPV